MSKTSNVKPTPVNQPNLSTWPGIKGFDQDLKNIIDDYAANNIAVESLSLPKDKPVLKNPVAGDDCISDNIQTTSIFKKNDAYYVFFHISELSSSWGANLTSFSIWLMSLSAKETVYIHQTGDVWGLTDIVQIIGILGTECKARKVFVVDHPIENALFLLSCDDVIITELGALTFTNSMCIDPSKWDLIYMPYMKSLFAKAVERKYITTTEVDAILKDNAIIFKTAKQLREQGISII